jgi:hypothetical protein
MNVGTEKILFIYFNKHSITLIRDHVPELNAARICQYSEDHKNVMGMLNFPFAPLLAGFLDG